MEYDESFEFQDGEHFRGEARRFDLGRVDYTVPRELCVEQATNIVDTLDEVVSQLRQWADTDQIETAAPNVLASAWAKASAVLEELSETVAAWSAALHHQGRCIFQQAVREGLITEFDFPEHVRPLFLEAKRAMHVAMGDVPADVEVVIPDHLPADFS